MHIGAMIVSSLIHGLVYGAIFKAMRHMPLSEAILVAVVGIGVIWLLSSAFGSRGRRRYRR